MLDLDKALLNLQETLDLQERSRILMVNAILAAVAASTPKNTNLRGRIKRIVARGKYSSDCCVEILNAGREFRRRNS